MWRAGIAAIITCIIVVAIASSIVVVVVVIVVSNRIGAIRRRIATTRARCATTAQWSPWYFAACVAFFLDRESKKRILFICIC